MTHVFFSPAAAEATPGAHMHLDGDEGHHAVKVRRIAVGEPVELIDGCGARAAGVVHAVQKQSCTVAVESVVLEPPLKPSITVIQALTKKDRSDQVIELLTEVGVDVVLPWRAQRSVMSEVPAKWARIIVESCKQSRQSRFPQLMDVADTAAAAQFLQAEVAAGAQALVCHESAAAPVTSVLDRDAPAYVIVIGPEGGLTDGELEVFTAGGAEVVLLGPTVLRAATAGAVAASIVTAVTQRHAGEQGARQEGPR